MSSMKRNASQSNIDVSLGKTTSSFLPNKSKSAGEEQNM
jgi:hypothetical protein